MDAALPSNIARAVHALLAEHAEHAVRRFRLHWPVGLAGTAMSFVGRGAVDQLNEIADRFSPGVRFTLLRTHIAG